LPRDRNFRLLFAGQVASLLGDGMVPVALSFAVLELTGSVSDLGIVLTAQAVPLVAFLLLGGVFADRLSRRRVMLGADLVRGAVQAASAALLIAGTARLWELIVLQAVYGLATAFFTPAISGLMPLVTRGEHLQQANALRGLAQSAGRIVGPALAGVLVAVGSPGWALAVDAATFGVSTATLAALAVPPSARLPAQRIVHDLIDGWREFTALPWAVAIVAAVAAGSIPWAAWPVLGPKVSRDALGGAGAWALISAGSGVGALVGGLAALRVRARRPLVAASATMLVFPVPLALLALEAPAAVIAVAALGGGFATTFFNALWETALQRAVPPTALSRVTAYDWFGSLALNPIGYVVIGPIAVAVGLHATLWLAAAALLATVAGPLFVPSLWRVSGGVGVASR
jgi:predicted MFS family arabinose efflux permease